MIPAITEGRLTRLSLILLVVMSVLELSAIGVAGHVFVGETMCQMAFKVLVLSACVASMCALGWMAQARHGVNTEVKYMHVMSMVIFIGFCAGNVATFLGDKYCS